MKIQKLTFHNHPAIGSLALDFTDGTGGTFSTIVLAGGNGTGKTIILEAIQKTFEPDVNGPPIGVIGMELEFTDEEVRQVNGPVEQQHQQLPPDVREFRLVYDTAIIADWSAYSLSWADPTTGGRGQVTPILGNSNWAGIFRSFLSEAAVNFDATQVSTVTAMRLDDGELRTTRSGPSLGTQIAQLIVDIRAADAEDLTLWVHAHPGEAPADSIKDVRFSRFRTAFEYMFPAKRFSKIERERGQIVIEFEELGRTSTLDQLSTGEKQVVFRAGFLLRNLAAVRKSVVLVDEPELSLHPEWQSRITGFYTHLLSDDSGHHPQLIFSTHSPFIVHGAANARVIVLQKDMTSGVVSEMPTPYYPGVTGSEAIRAFNIDSFLTSARQPLLILTEGESDCIIFEKAWEKLYPNKARPFELRAALGDRNVQITLNDQDLFTKLGPDRLILGVFDFDSAYDRWNGVWRKGTSALVTTQESAGLVKRHGNEKGWAMLLPVPAFRSEWASQALKGQSILSVEFLFEDADIPPEMVGHKTLPRGQSIPYFKQNHKAEFASHVGHLPAASFAAFAPLFERWQEILDGTL